MRVLIVEDNPERVKAFMKLITDGDHTAEITALPELAIGSLCLHRWDWVFLDHDLGGQTYAPSDSKSGYAVAEYLERNPAHTPTRGVGIHSMNPAGVKRMQAALPNAIICTGIWLASSAKFEAFLEGNSDGEFIPVI